MCVVCACVSPISNDPSGLNISRARLAHKGQGVRTNNQLPTTAPTDDTRRVVTMRSPRAWRKSRHRRSPDSVIDSIKLESTGATESDSGSPFASPLGTRPESTSGSPFLLASPGPTPEPSGSPLSAPPESTSASPLPTPSTGHLHVAATPPRHIRLPKSIVGETNASLRRVRRTLSMPHLKQDDARKWTEAISYDQRSPRSVKLAVGYFEQHQSGARGKSLRGAKLGRPARAEASERATTTTQTARWLLTAGLALLAASALACAAAAVRPEELTPPPTGTGAAASQPTELLQPEPCRAARAGRRPSRHPSSSLRYPSIRVVAARAAAVPRAGTRGSRRPSPVPGRLSARVKHQCVRHFFRRFAAA